jgi:hypothetical protein
MNKIVFLIISLIAIPCAVWPMKSHKRNQEELTSDLLYLATIATISAHFTEHSTYSFKLLNEKCEHIDSQAKKLKVTLEELYQKQSLSGKIPLFPLRTSPINNITNKK